MNFQKYYNFKLNEDQKRVLKQLNKFLHDDHDIFILTGYAGTGKTTLIRGFLDYLDEISRPYYLWASTGRAANVLANITRRPASTIHSAIYVLDTISDPYDETIIRLVFRLRENFHDPATIYFIDESSMISDREERENQFLQFDDGRLLNHLFKFAGNRKIVFIGDRAQLPPVNCHFSAALEQEYLSDKYQKKVIHEKLTKVERYDVNSGIYWNSLQLRSDERDDLPPMAIKTSDFSDMLVLRNTWVSIDSYVNYLRLRGVEHSVFISQTNGGVHYLNQQIRRKYYRHPDPPLQVGDMLMIVHNNYLYGIFNGQSVKVCNLEPTILRQHDFLFQDAVVEIPETGRKLNVRLMLNLLDRKEPNLSLDEERKLLINFAIRMKDYGIKRKDPTFLERLSTDPYVNALRVKYGYAVTCHKAQGGEWDRVYISAEPVLDNFDRRYLYRWFYTAITRAKSELFFSENKYLY